MIHHKKRIAPLLLAFYIAVVIAMPFFAFAGPLQAQGSEESQVPASDASAQAELSTKTSDDTQGLINGAVAGTLGAKNSTVADVSADDVVYLNGATGSDDNPGTEDEPVKTFTKAKEVMENYGSDIIWVTGTVTLSGTSETWDLSGKTIMRDVAFRGELVHLTNGASLTLKNIVIDGANGDGAKAVASRGDGSGGSLIGLFGTSSEKCTLNVDEGAALQNNYILSKGGWMPESGGAVYADNGVVNVRGGSILNNKAVYGGGICAVFDSEVNVSSGEISGNEALQGSSSKSDALKGYSGCGGGICAWRGAAVNVSGGSIENNVAFNRGGGISMGTLQTFYDPSSVLTMTGGSVSNNKAGSAGGGIFVQAGLSEEGGDGTPSYCIAKVSGGTLSGNAMTGTGDSNSSFGGGAIYVNGYSSEYSQFHNGELYLTNVEVSGNVASVAGGGYAGCPVSNTGIELTNGAAFYGNTTDGGNARELYILASTAYGAHSGNPSYEVSPSMLGGGAYKWAYDDGSEVPLDKLKGTLNAQSGEELCLSNDLDANSPAVVKALELAEVHIVDNTSVTRGGGIGSNGSVFIGKTPDANTTEVTACKKWSDDGNKDQMRPGSVVFELYRDGEYVGFQTVEPDADDAWETVFENLPKTDGAGNEYEYTVKERTVEGYTSQIEGNAASGFIVTNVRIENPPASEEPDNPAPEGAEPAAVPKTGDNAGGLVFALLVTIASGAAAAIVRALKAR